MYGLGGVIHLLSKNTLNTEDIYHVIYMFPSKYHINSYLHGEKKRWVKKQILRKLREWPVPPSIYLFFNTLPLKRHLKRFFIDNFDMAWFLATFFSPTFPYRASMCLH